MFKNREGNHSTVETNWDERCDCGSGRKYRHCCGKRRYKKFLEEQKAKTE